GIEKLFALGDQSQKAAVAFGKGRHFQDMTALVAAVLAELPTTGSVLVKGSRFMKMEQLVQALADHAQQHRSEPHAA
ncbi:MAG: UDP-N-acetylmuramoylalanyl-D-glutamyl-2, 6-diaminopimelate--D-alanyl-D-alanine ligase, partial [Polaromonas sp.]|nr:UDP-N-acetylmuramoylalanyl-D-glutamyl-2, 6-diaminopimelate--D-alanyl-D-alanine ligase [Polaromonas sp.]